MLWTQFNDFLTSHRGQSGASRGLSNRLWTHANSRGMTPDGAAPGRGLIDDFEGNIALSSTGLFVSNSASYYGFIENSGTIAKLATEVTGVVQLKTGATADNATSFGTAHVAGDYKVGVGTPGSVTAVGGKLIWEARVRWPVVTDALMSAFIGLVEQARIVDNGTITDSHAMAEVDHLGFYQMDDDGNALNFGYGVNSTTPVELIEDVLTIKPATWYKIGFVYDSAFRPSQRIKVFVDNEEQGAYVTETIIEAVTFPGGEEMGLIADIKADDTTTPELDIDWWAVYQGE